MGRIPLRMIRTIALFMEFCYIVRRHVLDDDDIDKLNTLLVQFHQEREIFREAGIRSDFCLPRQHSLNHYANSIMKFGAPNSLCSSITESKHIEAVKKPWRRSNRFNALSQMLITNQRLNKLATITVEFSARRMLSHSIWNGFVDPPPPAAQDDNVDGNDGDGEAINDSISCETKLAIYPSKHSPFLSLTIHISNQSSWYSSWYRWRSCLVGRPTAAPVGFMIPLSP
jgi:hypothetical protein